MQFEQLYNEYSDRIFRLCMSYVNDRALAKDLTQETFIIVWQQLDKFRQESSIGTWIYRIASNNCLKMIRKNKVNRTAPFPVDIPEKIEASLEPEINLLYQFISELPEIDRIIISLELEELPQAEIANIVGLSAANVRVRIHRIKEKLTLKFKSHG